MGVRVVWGVGVVLCASRAMADVASLDNGHTGTGSLAIGPDEYGTFGFGLSQMQADNFRVANKQAQPATNFYIPYLTVTTPDLKTSVVALSDNPKVAKFLQNDQNGSALQGAHVGLARVSAGFSSTSSTDAQSAFSVVSTTNNPAIDVGFTLHQALSYDAATNTTQLDQTYVITNNGGSSLDLRFAASWDPDLIWTVGLAHNVAGVGQGKCYVYVRDSSGADQAVILTDGGSTVPFTGYYGGKAGQQPTDLGSPNYDPKAAPLFAGFGIPASWHDDLALVGYDKAGEAPEVPNGDADMAIEWAFTLAIGQTETLVVRRIYGTATMPCPAGPSCGSNSTVDPGEDCETGGVDTPSCVGSVCRTSTCGDGYVNAAAGEECESNMADTETCIGAMCKTSTCGDGYINAAAGEQCDDMGESADCNADCTMATCGDGVINAARGEECEAGELCDPTTCTTNFELGGGCAGCASSGDASWLLALGVLALRRRRAHCSPLA